MNKVILSGNLVRDVELQQTPSGTSVARFTVAVRRRFAKEGQQQADFINCIAWRTQAEFLSKYFQKGSGIQVCGSIQTRSWDGQDGAKHFATDVIAEEIEFCGSKRQSNDTASTASPQNLKPLDTGYPDTDGFGDLVDDDDDLPF